MDYDYNDYEYDNYYEEDGHWCDDDFVNEFHNDNMIFEANRVVEQSNEIKEAVESQGKSRTHDNNSYSRPPTEKILPKEQQCPICCEDRPLIALMRECNHPPTCYHCLRQIYVVHAQQSVTNYPLECYHPSCNKVVRDTQLIKHNLVLTEKELQKHYRFSTLAKAYTNSQRYKVVHCPDCDTPRAVINNTLVKCRNCSVEFLVAHEGVTNEKTTLAVLNLLKQDEKGDNDGIARCPKCNIFISKGYGCDHMICVCGWNFSWVDARLKQGKMKSYKIVEATKNHGCKILKI